jgi:hypothetical protein
MPLTGTIPTEVVLLANASLERMHFRRHQFDRDSFQRDVFCILFWVMPTAFMDCSACSADMTSDYWDLFGSACYIEPNGCIKSHPEAGA